MIKIHDTYDYPKVFTQEEVLTFAEFTKDLNPRHIDKKYAEQTEFGRQIVQGVLINCAFSTVFFTLWPADENSFFISVEEQYLKPVYVDEQYTLHFECTDIDYKRCIGTIDAVIKDHNDDQILKMKARLYSKLHFSAPKF